MVLVAQVNKKNPVQVITRKNICYIKDTNFDYVLPLTFSTKESMLAKSIAKEFNNLLNKYITNKQTIVESEDCYND